jgi:hypothetical protein
MVVFFDKRIILPVKRQNSLMMLIFNYLVGGKVGYCIV